MKDSINLLLIFLFTIIYWLNNINIKILHLLLYLKKHRKIRYIVISGFSRDTWALENLVIISPIALSNSGTLNWFDDKLIILQTNVLAFFKISKFSSLSEILFKLGKNNHIISFILVVMRKYLAAALKPIIPDIYII